MILHISYALQECSRVQFSNLSRSCLRTITESMRQKQRSF